MSSQSIDHAALLPLYAAAATALLAFLTDLFIARRPAVLAVTALGTLATAAGALLTGDRSGTFCLAGAEACSWVPTWPAAVTAVLFAGLTAGVLALSAPALRLGVAPAGEFCFLLACSMTGGVTVAYAGDLITLIVGLETLTLPLYVLVGLRRFAPGERVTTDAASASVTFFLISVVSTAIALLGAALTYASTGAVHLALLGTPPPTTAGAAPGAVAPGAVAPGVVAPGAVAPGVVAPGAVAPGAVAPDAVAPGAAAPGGLEALPGGAVPAGLEAIAAVGAALLVIGLAFKVAAVPLHAWAPATYDGAPVPVAAYLSTASKLGGILALAAIVSRLDTAIVVAVLAVLTMTVGNLVALRQTRMVRLLAWSSVAQAGYILAALALGAAGVVAALAYAAFFVVLELIAFGVVVALRPPTADGGELTDYRGAARRSPWLGAAMVLALAGLAGLPPGLAGLFAKLFVVEALVQENWTWLAGVVLINAVIALAYYVRVGALLYTAPAHADPVPAPTRPALPVPRPVAAALIGAVAVAVLLGFAPQLLFNSLT